MIDLFDVFLDLPIDPLLITNFKNDIQKLEVTSLTLKTQV